ncbi:MAG: PepSY domain-containing protein [Nitrosomonas sp.]|nr:PepSY domain-containing protein [Nitrosomonas sp.]
MTAKRTGISPQEAAAIAQRSIGGRVLSVSHESPHYRVKILNTKGNIQVVTVDARSGAILSAR